MAVSPSPKLREQDRPQTSQPPGPVWQITGEVVDGQFVGTARLDNYDIVYWEKFDAWYTIIDDTGWAYGGGGRISSQWSSSRNVRYQQGGTPVLNFKADCSILGGLWLEVIGREPPDEWRDSGPWTRRTRVNCPPVDTLPKYHNDRVEADPNRFDVGETVATVSPINGTRWVKARLVLGDYDFVHWYNFDRFFDRYELRALIGWDKLPCQNTANYGPSPCVFGQITVGDDGMFRTPHPSGIFEAWVECHPQNADATLTLTLSTLGTDGGGTAYGPAGGAPEKVWSFPQACAPYTDNNTTTIVRAGQ